MRSSQLGLLEQRVMDVVWQKKECSIRDVLLQLEQQKGVAYTTVATIMQRLYEKKLVVRKQDGKGFLYAPGLTKESYTKRLAVAFLKRFITSYGDTAIVSFAESIDDLPKEKKAYLLKLLEQHESHY